jgi:transposase
MSLLQLGHSKDHRPDLRQFKVMLATLDPLGLPLVCEMVAGQRADDGLYLPAYEAACRTLGTREVLVVGDSKMGAFGTRAQIAAAGSCYLSAYRPPSAKSEVADWISQALTRQSQWHRLERVEMTTGEVVLETVVDEWRRELTWTDSEGQQAHTWTERVLVARSTAAQSGLTRRLEVTLARLCQKLAALGEPVLRGRKHYRTHQELETVVTKLIAQANLSGVVQTTLTEEALPNGSSRWIVSALWVERAAWQAQVDRLGWQVYLTNTTPTHYETAALIEAYHQQAIHERGFARLKSRALHIRPVFVRDEGRIAGLVWLLTLALRLLTLTEHRLRVALAERQESLAGLNPASPTQATHRPTTERVLALFANITRTTIRTGLVSFHHVSPLSQTQQHVLCLLGLPPDLYTRLAGPLPTSPPRLPEP